MKITLNILFSVLFFLILMSSCEHTATNHRPQIIDTVEFISKDTVRPGGDTIMTAGKDADTVYKLILSLPEVTKRARYIQEQTKGERHLEVMIAESPKDGVRDYYWVKAGEDNGNAYVTHFNFYVFPTKNWEIKYLDPVKNVVISMADWRKENKALEQR